MALSIFTGIINSSNLDANDIYLTYKSNEQALNAFAEKLGVNYSYDDAT
ncbi:pyrroline-5-carboxylate reductase, partial [Staphylococcus aureus]|nr:pyrroline-5-carboxylate reductase [Staphylococcus aureus]